MSLWGYLRRLLRIDCYSREGEYLVRSEGLYKTRIPISKIATWHRNPEQCFDVIEITFEDETRLTWLDYYGDLHEMLKEHLGQKERA